MIKAICDMCGETVKGKMQYYIEISSCKNGTSSNPNGPENHNHEIFADLCHNCFRKLEKEFKK